MRETFCFMIAATTIAMAFQPPVPVENAPTIAFLGLAYIVGLAGILALLISPRNGADLFLAGVFIVAMFSQYGTVRASALAYVAKATGNPGALVESLQLEPNNAARWVKMGERYMNAHNETGRAEFQASALACYRRAVELDPRHPAAQGIQ